MARFIIHGGKRLSGTTVPSGNKNAVLPMLAACVLTDKPVTLENVPLIEDVHTMLELLAALGVEIAVKDHTVTLCAKGLRRSKLDPVLCRKVRSSILLAGPMAARLGKVTLSPPGGDVIGRRRLDTHFQGLQALGIDVEGGQNFVFRRKRFEGAAMVLDEASVTATENVLMAAVLARGVTTIHNAAREPEITDLAHMLISMGADISGLGSSTLTVRGVTALSGTRYRVIPDRIETGTYLAAVALAGGAEVFIMDEPSSELDEQSERELLEHLHRMAKDEGKTVLLAHHGFGLISGLAPVMCVVNHGHVSLVNTQDIVSAKGEKHD